MNYNERLYAKLEERKRNSEITTELELDVNGENIAFVGYGVEEVKEEKGAVSVDPSKNGSRIFVSKGNALPFEASTTNGKLDIMTGTYSLQMEDSVEKGRVIRYQIGVEVEEIFIKKNGNYQISRGEMKSDDDGRRIILSVENTELIIEGFDEECRLRYVETSKAWRYKLIVDIKSQKEVNTAKRNEVLIEFQKIADDLNGDKHGLARGITRILNDNDVPVVYQ
jgi:hypothetical protein